MFYSLRFIQPLLLAAWIAALGACSGPSDSQLLVSARGFLDKRENASAIIELRNLLQQSPESREGRFLLGKVLLETGGAASAHQARRGADRQAGRQRPTSAGPGV